MSGVDINLDLNITLSDLTGLATLPSSVPRLTWEAAEVTAVAAVTFCWGINCSLTMRTWSSWVSRGQTRRRQRWDHSQAWFFCRQCPSQPTLPRNSMLVCRRLNYFRILLNKVSIIYICQAVVTRMQLTRRVLERKKQTRRGWNLSVRRRRGGWRRGWSDRAPALIPAPGSCSSGKNNIVI